MRPNDHPQNTSFAKSACGVQMDCIRELAIMEYYSIESMVGASAYVYEKNIFNIRSCHSTISWKREGCDE